MKKKIILLTSAVIIGSLSFSFIQKPTIVSDNAPLRYANNEAFGLAEELYYRVGYKFITAGTGSFKIMPQPLWYNGVQCYDINFEVRSLPSLEWIYKVRDNYRTVLDIVGIFPWHFEQHIREANYAFDFQAAIDQKNRIAKTTEGEFPIDQFTHDIVSAFYYVRTLDLKPKHKGDIIHLKNFYGKKMYDLDVRIMGRQTVKVEAGTFNCVVIEPLVVEGGLFKNEGKILVWLTDDDRKVPVKVSTKILIGSVDAELTSYKGLRGPLTAKVEDE